MMRRRAEPSVGTEMVTAPLCASTAEKGCGVKSASVRSLTLMPVTSGGA